MKDKLKLLFKQVVFDKVLLGVMVALLVTVVVFCVVMAIGIKPSDLQVSVQYTAYGDAHFYRGSWISLISFVLFGLLVGVMNAAVSIKLLVEKGRSFAVVYLVATIFVLVLAGALLHRIITIAALS